MANIAIELLGPPKVAVDGDSVSIGRRRSMALLAFLAVSRDRISRSEIAELLRPGLPPESSRTSLRRTLYELKRRLGTGWLRVDASSLQLRSDTPDIHIDVQKFSRLVAACRTHGHEEGQVCPDCEAPVREAIELYRGEFMAGFGLDDSPEMDDWQSRQAERLRQDFIGCLKRLTLLSQLDDGTANPEVVRRWLALDPLSEEAHRAAMRLYAAAGQRAAAEEQLRRCAQTLERELGVEPSDETVELWEAIRREASVLPGERASRWLATSRTVARSASTAKKLTTDSPLALPMPATPFVGRRGDLEKLEELLTQPGCRLLTLVGPGGIGKTRLALELGRRQAAHFAGRVAFVPLASVSSPDRILNTCIDVLGLVLHGGQALESQLADFLDDGPFLLILDNYEHLVSSTDLPHQLLEKCSELRILTTSREPLNSRHEWLFRVGGLGQASSGGRDATDDEALDFFVACARRSDSSFALTDVHREPITRICELVGGIPLALELAAAWVRAMPPEKITQRIARDLDFLSTSQQDMPPRHRSLRALFEHSLLPLRESERAALTRLSIFHGAFSDEAAQQVADAPVEVLASLVDRSLIQVTNQGFYQIHELLRQYAEKTLGSEPGEKERVSQLHTRYYLCLLETWQRYLDDKRVSFDMNLLYREMENLRTAWRDACERGWVEQLDQALEAMHFLHEVACRYAEGWELMDDAVRAFSLEATTAPRATVALGRALVRRGWHGGRCGRYREMERDLGRAEQIFTDTGASQEGAAAFLTRALSHHLQGHYRQAKDDYIRGLDLARESGLRWYEAHIQTLLGFMHYDLGDHVAARIAAQRAVEVCREANNPYALAWALMTLGNLARIQGNYRQAKELYLEGLEASRKLGRHGVSGFCYSKLGTLARYGGDFEEAEARYRQAMSFFESRGHRPGLVRCLNNLAELQTLRGDLTATCRYAERALALSEVPRSRPGIAFSLANLGTAALLRGSFEHAAEQFRKCLGIYEDMGSSPRLIWACTRLARALWGLGEHDEARELLARSYAAGKEMGATVLVLEVLHVVAEALAREGRKDRAGKIASHALHHPDCPWEITNALRPLAIEAPGSSNGQAEPPGSTCRVEDLMTDFLCLDTSPPAKTWARARSV